EKAIAQKSSTAILDPMLKDFGNSMDEFMGLLRAALPRETLVAAVATTLDKDKARKAVEEMMAHLNSFDPTAADCLEAYKNIFQTILAESYETFEKQINQFAFAEAIAILYPAVKQKGVLPA